MARSDAVHSAVEVFIDAQGAQALADAAGKTLAAVRVWKHRHVIPRQVWPELLQAIPDLTMAKLLEIERLSAPFVMKRGRAA